MQNTIGFFYSFYLLFESKREPKPITCSIRFWIDCSNPHVENIIHSLSNAEEKRKNILYLVLFNRLFCNFDFGLKT